MIIISKLIDRTGERFQDKLGNWGTIVKYNTGHDIWVTYDECNECELIHADYGNIRRKSILSPYAKTVYNIGYYGFGKYVAKINGEHTPQYKHWHAMMVRCYANNQNTIHPAYKGCSVCEEWLNFQNFAKWFDDNYYEIDNNYTMALDKDILNKGNKIYNPNDCVFVNQRINSLFIKNDKIRGNLPIGVQTRNDTKKYIAISCNGNGNKSLGSFNTPEEAFNAYKKDKEQYIKQVADEYKDKIPKKLYDAMYKYEVEITD